MDLINATDKDGASPVHLACRQGLAQYLRRLLDRGGDVFASDKSARFPALYCAPTSDLQECLRLCLAVMFFGGRQLPPANSASAAIAAALGEERSTFLMSMLMAGDSQNLLTQGDIGEEAASSAGTSESDMLY